MKQFKVLCTLFSCLFISFSGNSQFQIQDWGPAFPQDEVTEVHIDIQQEFLDYILHPDSVWSNIEYPSSFHFISSTEDITIDSVGFRLRGNTSRLADKKSFKVSFNNYTNGGNFFGLQKMNLNSNQNDVSLLRAKLCWDGIRDANLPGSRISYTRLYINEEYKGLYINTEQIDDMFVDQTFEGVRGNLYKCLWPADLHYLGDDPEDYKIEQNGRRTYDLKTNQTLDDYTDISELIISLNNLPDETFVCEFPKYFHIEEYLKLLAIDVLTGNWDGGAFNKNNFYLYFDNSTRKFHYIPYDLDNTLGIDWYGIDWAYRDPYAWSPEWEYRPLYERLMSFPEFRNLFSKYLDDLSEGFFNPGNLSVYANNLQDLIEESAIDDPYRELDFGFTTEDFLNAIDETWGGHVNYGIIPYLEERIASINTVLEAYTPVAVPNQIFDNTPLLAEEALVVSVDVFLSEADEALIHFRHENGDWQSAGMNDLGIDGDELMGDGIWSVSLSSDTNSAYLEYYLEIVANGMGAFYPCFPQKVWTKGPNNGMVVNELMAQNNSVIADEADQFDDWIELYNGGSTALNLGNYYLTDKRKKPNKWPIPSVSLNSNDWILFWADDDQGQGGLHTNFKLSSAGEAVGVFSIEDNAYRFVDYISFPALLPDVSYGRSYDASPEWIFFESSTPDASNGTVSVIESPESNLLIYPNPASGNQIFLSESRSGEVRNSLGAFIMKFPTSISLELGNLSNGLYVIRTDRNEQLKFILNR